MELAQIFILALCVASVTMHHCYNEVELEKRAKEILKKKKFPLPPNTEPSRNSPSGCPVEFFSGGEKVNDRSISPWKYETVTNTEYYPQTYTQAVCLCQGCIMANSSGTLIHNESYNSVEVKGSWVFMKRVKCQKHGYRLEQERRDVTLGCTCVKPTLLG